MSILDLENSDELAEVDEIDYQHCKQYKWYLEGTRPYTWLNMTDNSRICLRLHILIAQRMGIYDPDKEIDHKNRDGLNNKRSNLRVATPSQNGANKPGKNKYKGVTYHKQRDKYQS